MSFRSLTSLRSALACLAVVGVLLRAGVPGVAIAAPAMIEALTGSVICAHGGDGTPTPAPGHHTGPGDECCTAACSSHALLGITPTVIAILASRDGFAVAAPQPACDARAPRPPPRTSHSPRGPPTLI